MLSVCARGAGFPVLRQCVESFAAGRVPLKVGLKDVKALLKKIDKDVGR